MNAPIDTTAPGWQHTVVTLPDGRQVVISTRPAFEPGVPLPADVQEQLETQLARVLEADWRARGAI